MDRFTQIKPKVIFSVDAVRYNKKIHNHLGKLTQVVQSMYGGMHVMFGGLGDKWYKQLIGPLQLAIHVVQNHHAGEQKSHREKTNKGNYHLKLCVPFVCLVPEPHEWQTAKGLFLTAQEIQIISIPRFFD